MLKFSGTIRSRIYRAMMVVCLSGAALSGLCIYAMSMMKTSFSQSSAELKNADGNFMSLRTALEQTIDHTAVDGSDSAVTRKSRAAFTQTLNSMQTSFAGRSWTSGLDTLKLKFEATEHAGRETQAVQLGELRDALDQVRMLSAQEPEHQLAGRLDYLFYLIFPFSFFALMIPGLSLYLTARTINRDLSVYAQSLLHFSEANDQTSETLRDASQNLSSASTEQSAAVQETVASIAEIRSMLAQTSNHVREVQALTTTVNDKTHNGSQTMAKMESAMIAIEEANSQLKSFEEIIRSIREKTQVINDIVFKTQLLSFNASIEAARAGQYGRGFAVVAEEVGKLAHLSGSASREIDQLLSDSQKRVIHIVEAVKGRVVDGKEVSGEALKRFGEIALEITTISDKINQVNEATLEQESGVEQTAKAMDQMDATAVDSKKAADQILKIAEKARHLSGRIREVTEGIQTYVDEEGAQPAAAPVKGNVRRPQRTSSPNKGGGVVDLVSRLAQKKNAPVAPSRASDFSADDPSFKKPGEN